MIPADCTKSHTQTQTTAAWSTRASPHNQHCWRSLHHLLHQRWCYDYGWCFGRGLTRSVGRRTCSRGSCRRPTQRTSSRTQAPTPALTHSARIHCAKMRMAQQGDARHGNSRTTNVSDKCLTNASSVQYLCLVNRPAWTTAWTNLQTFPLGPTAQVVFSHASCDRTARQQMVRETKACLQNK